jgi:hypothetical protein
MLYYFVDNPWRNPTKLRENDFMDAFVFIPQDETKCVLLNQGNSN